MWVLYYGGRYGPKKKGALLRANQNPNYKNPPHGTFGDKGGFWEGTTFRRTKLSGPKKYPLQSGRAFLRSPERGAVPFNRAPPPLSILKGGDPPSEKITPRVRHKISSPARRLYQNKEACSPLLTTRGGRAFLPTNET